MPTKYAWLCASTDSRRDRYGNEMAGRRCHAVPYEKGETAEDFKNKRSVCGKKAKHGWCVDLFNKNCKRCEAKLKGGDDEQL